MAQSFPYNAGFSVDGTGKRLFFNDGDGSPRELVTLDDQGNVSLTWTQNVTGAVVRTVGTKLNESLSVKDVGAGSGGTSENAYFAAAAALGRTSYVPDGTYLLKTNGSTAFSTVANTGFVGNGEPAVLEVREESETSTSEVITNGGAGFTLAGVKVLFTKLFTGFSTAIFLKTRHSKITLRNVKFDGGIAMAGGSASHSVQIVKSHNGAGTNTVIFDNVETNNVSRVYTRDNGDTDTQSTVKVLGGVFRNMWRTAFTFNAPGGNIDDVAVVGATFDTHAGEANADPGVSGNHNAVGFVGVRGGRVVGCGVRGLYGALIHVEENSKGGAVTGNSVYMANVGSSDAVMETLANNIGGPTSIPVYYAYAGNALVSSDGVGQGIAVQSQASADGLRYSVYSGNAVGDFDRAFNSATDLRSVLVTHNMFKGVTLGANLTRASLLFTGNLVPNAATSPLQVARGGAVGAMHYVNLASARAAMTAWATSTGSPVTLTEWTWETDLFSTVNGAQNIDMGPMPLRIEGTMLIELTQSGSVHRRTLYNVNYDGAVFTLTSRMTYGAGLITITGVVNNAGQLAIALNDGNGGGSANVRMQVRFSDGAMIV